MTLRPFLLLKNTGYGGVARAVRFKTMNAGGVQECPRYFFLPGLGKHYLEPPLCRWPYETRNEKRLKSGFRGS